MTDPVDFDTIACGQVEKLVNTEVVEECALMGEFAGESTELLRRRMAVADAHNSEAFHGMLPRRYLHEPLGANDNAVDAGA